MNGLVSGKNLGKPSLYTRSLGQATQLWPNVVDTVGDTYNNAKDIYDNPGQAFDRASQSLLAHALRLYDGAIEENKKLKK